MILGENILKNVPVGLGVGETETIELTGDAILAIKTESSSGLIYWTGKDYQVMLRNCWKF